MSDLRVSDLYRHCLLTCFSKKNRCLNVRDATTYAKCTKPSCKVQSMQAKSPIQNNQYSRTHKSKQRIYIYIILYILEIMQRKHVNKHTRTHTPKDSITLCQDGGLTVIEHDGAGRLPLVVVIAVASPPLASSSSPHRRHVVITSSPCRRNVVAMSSPCRRHVVAMSSPCCGHAVAMPSPFNCLAVGVPIHCCRHLVVLPSTHCQCLLPSF